MEIWAKDRFLSTFRILKVFTQRNQGSSTWSNNEIGINRRVMKEFILRTNIRLYLFQTWSILSIDESAWFRTFISADRLEGWIGIVKAPLLKVVYWACPKGAVQCLLSLHFTFRSTSGSFVLRSSQSNHIHQPWPRHLDLRYPAAVDQELKSTAVAWWERSGGF